MIEFDVLVQLTAPDAAEAIIDGHAHALVDEAVQAAGGRSACVLLEVCRQDQLIESAYLRRVHAGDHHPFAEQFPELDRHTVDYGALADGLAALPGVERVVALPLELAGAGRPAYAAHALEALGVGHDLEVLRTALAPRRDYTRQGLDLALAMNPLLGTTEERHVLHEMLMQNFAAADGQRARVLADDARAAIVARHRDVNAAFFRTWLPSLPPDSYSGDEDTATLAAVLDPVEPLEPPSPGTARKMVRRLRRRVRRVRVRRSARLLIAD